MRKCSQALHPAYKIINHKSARRENAPSFRISNTRRTRWKNHWPNDNNLGKLMNTSPWKRLLSSL